MTTKTPLFYVRTGERTAIEIVSHAGGGRALRVTEVDRCCDTDIMPPVALASALRDLADALDANANDAPRYRWMPRIPKMADWLLGKG